MSTNPGSQTKELVLLEFPDELDLFLSFRDNEGKTPEVPGFTVIALQPEVGALCKQKNLPFLDTLPFFTNASHQRILEASHRLTRLLENELNFNMDSPVTHVYSGTFIYYARFYINNYLWLLEVLQGIRQKYTGAGISTVTTGPFHGTCETHGDSPFLTLRDRFLGSIAGTFCREYGLVHNEIGGSGDQIPPGGRSKTPPAVPRFIRDIARGILRKKLRKLARRKSVFIASPSYNLDRLCKEAGEHVPGLLCVTVTRERLSLRAHVRFCLKEMINGFTGIRDNGEPVPVPIELLDANCNETHGRGSSPEVFGTLYREFAAAHGHEFQYAGCSFLAEFSGKVERGLLPHLLELHRKALAQQLILEDMKPNLLLAPMSIGTEHSWGELCRKRNIPAMVIPQKGLIAPQNPFARIEEYYIGKVQVTDDFSHTASQSPMVSGYLKWAGYNGTVIETGNLILSRTNPAKQAEKREEFYREIGGVKRVIVYAPSMKSRKSRRFYVLETLDELVSSVGDVMAAVNGKEDLHLVMRIHPGEPITRRELTALLPVPANVSFSDSGTFEDVLAFADLVVSFSSTSIQESLLNDVPVVLYDKWKRYNHLDAPAPPLDKGQGWDSSAVFYIDDPGSLTAAFDRIPAKEGNPDSSLFRNYRFPPGQRCKFFDFVKQCCDGTM